MNAVNAEFILAILAGQSLKAMLVDTSAGKPASVPSNVRDIPGTSGIDQVLQNVRHGGNTLYADKMVFPAVKTQVGAVVVFGADGKVLCFCDELDRSPRTPRGGDVIVDFSKGIVQL